MADLILLFGDGEESGGDVASAEDGYREVLLDQDWTTVRWPRGYGATVEALALYIEGFGDDEFVLFEGEDGGPLAIRRDRIGAIA